MIKWSNRDLGPGPAMVSTGDWFVSRAGVIGKVTALPGRRDELVELLLAGAALASSAPGCYLYVVNLSASDPDEVWVAEAWRSRAYHEAWLVRAEVRDLIAKTNGLIASTAAPAITIPIGGKGLAVRRVRS
jgi:quinol monooxygenase YgiN